ncbi:MAG: glycerol-3-phosphate 1-O-acyltransferase PlsY [Candidatus Cloacimonadaceae bacterium]|nr:glycerol-3-phosphate 1-O-acyltransferase PlsY [Candidatus Cloacimonadaceae bacterium]MDP3115210.1 glycerol-3-phosphate 1-O-acyltransferase PlsY [Candidatus Cloacimonadaceae bacterium]
MCPNSRYIVFMWLVALGSFLIGSIPFGWIIGKLFYKKDIRNEGSGNIGATNALRSYGAGAGILVLFLDAAKGFVVTYAALVFWQWEYLTLLAGLMVIMGHMHSAFLGFKGGKGVATAVGVFLVFAPMPFLIVLPLFVLSVLITRYVSFSSLLAAIGILVVAVVDYRFQPGIALLKSRYSSCEYICVVALIVALIIFKHLPNLKRLYQGTENRFGSSKKDIT